MSICSAPGPPHEEPGIRAELAELGGPGEVFVRRKPPDWNKLRVLGSGLGRYDARLVAYPAGDGSMVCYWLVGETRGPLTSHCYDPSDPHLPGRVKGQHFAALALYSAEEGKPSVQLFGIAFDDVVEVRAQVAGEWVDVPLGNNGFFVDLPGVRHEQVGIVEATLADGSTQIHDIQQGG